MREIKVAAYDAVENRIISPCDVPFDIDWGLQEFCEAFLGGFSDRYIPLLFTTLLDRDDKEIYEGDILECNEGGHTYRATIEWHDNGFWIKDESGRLHLPNKEFRRKVGNIHCKE